MFPLTCDIGAIREALLRPATLFALDWRLSARKQLGSLKMLDHLKTRRWPLNIAVKL